MKKTSRQYIILRLKKNTTFLFKKARQLLSKWLPVSSRSSNHASIVTIRALVKKELIQTLRDKRMRVLVLLAPVLQMFIFGVAISNEVKDFDTAWVDHDKSRLSREFKTKVFQTENFELIQELDDIKKAAGLLDINEVKAVVVIPAGFEKRMLRGDNSRVQVLIDGTDSNSSTIALGYLNEISARLSAQRTPSLNAEVVKLHTAVYFNPELNPRFYMIPGVFIFVLTVITTLLTAIAIVKEKESGTFEQLAVSPIRGHDLILGKMIPFLLIGTIDVILVSLVAVFGFQVPFHAPLVAFACLNFLFISAMLGLGLLISTISKTQQQAMMSMFLFLFPAIILSGFLFPLDNMPVAIQYVARLNPMLYAINAERDMMLKGSGFFELYDNMLALAEFAVVFAGYGVFRFRRMMVS